MPGKIGQASPQPIVMTTSDACTAWVVRTLGRSARMSIPSSSMASTATRLISPAGIEPAERTSTAPPDIADRSPAAIWERPALWTQTNRTLGGSVVSVIGLLSSFSGDVDAHLLCQGEQAGSTGLQGRCLASKQLALGSVYADVSDH